MGNSNPSSNMSVSDFDKKELMKLKKEDLADLLIEERVINASKDGIIERQKNQLVAMSKQADKQRFNKLMDRKVNNKEATQNTEKKEEVTETKIFTVTCTFTTRDEETKKVNFRCENPVTGTREEIAATRNRCEEHPFQ